jgi:hypothetical protein
LRNQTSRQLSPDGTAVAGRGLEMPFIKGLSIIINPLYTLHVSTPPTETANHQLKTLSTYSKKLMILALISALAFIFITSLIYARKKQKVLPETAVQDVTTSKSVDVSRIDKLITVLYYDNDLKKPVRNKFGIIITISVLKV